MAERPSLTATRSLNLRGIMIMVPRDRTDASRWALASLADGTITWPSLVDLALSIDGLHIEALTAIARLAYSLGHSHVPGFDPSPVIARVAFILRRHHNIAP